MTNQFFKDSEYMKLIYLIRDDLRINDNPALSAAALDGSVMIVFIHDTYQMKPRGQAFNWWTYHSLKKLELNLKDRYGVQINYYRGNASDLLHKLAQENQIERIYLNQAFDPDARALETSLGSLCKIFTANLLHHPNSTLNESGQFYKVFTAYWRKISTFSVRPTISPPQKIEQVIPLSKSSNLDQINLLPTGSWHQKFHRHWNPGEESAKAVLDDFLKNHLHLYRRGRDYPALQTTSRLSPYLAHGEISVVEIWHKINSVCCLEENSNVDSYLSELGWREFSYNLLYHLPKLADENAKSQFNNFKWEENPQHLEKWQKGLTGYPLVDAGMRELWETGWMHNRVRMIVGSFLTKDLLLQWQEGEKWFWDCLVDADYASNPASWQWVAGCGYDAAPYFRIFNPITQAAKFDPGGNYIKKWIKDLSPKHYPPYMVDHQKARKRALVRSKEIV